MATADKPSKVAFTVGTAEGPTESHDPIEFAFRGKPFKATHPMDVPWRVTMMSDTDPEGYLRFLLDGDQYKKLMDVKPEPTTGEIGQITQGINKAAGVTAPGEADDS